MFIKEVTINEDGRGEVTISYTFSVQAVDEKKMREQGRLPLTFSNDSLLLMMQDHLVRVIEERSKKVKSEFIKDISGWLKDYSTIQFLKDLGVEYTPLKVENGKVVGGLKND